MNKRQRKKKYKKPLYIDLPDGIGSIVDVLNDGFYRISPFRPGLFAGLIGCTLTTREGSIAELKSIDFDRGVIYLDNHDLKRWQVLFYSTPEYR